MSNEIQQNLRAAAGFERTALKAEADGEKAYEMKMKSAGASAFAAFKLALADAPEYQGRKIDDAAMRRIYASTKPRAWWDRHLAAVKQDREWGKRLIQWHLDPAAAKARRLQHSVRLLANRRKAQANPPAQGARAPQAAPRAAEMRAVAEAATTTALAGREAPRIEAPVHPTGADLINLCERIRRAALAVKPAERAAVLDILQTTAGEVERYVS